jgi:Putative transposase
MSDEPELARTTAASGQQRIAFGEHPVLTGPRCASVNGFSLHANTQVPAHRRDQLERLMRYTARGAVSLERLEEDTNGDLVYSFTKPWSDGTTGITLSPLELLRSCRLSCPCRGCP